MMGDWGASQRDLGPQGERLKRGGDELRYVLALRGGGDRTRRLEHLPLRQEAAARASARRGTRDDGLAGRPGHDRQPPAAAVGPNSEVDDPLEVLAELWASVLRVQDEERQLTQVALGERGLARPSDREL